MTCSVCSHHFVVRADDDVEALDPFASTKVDNPPPSFPPPPSFAPPPPTNFEADTTANEALPPSFDFEDHPHDAKTAVHIVPPGIRDREPASFDDMETLVDPPSPAVMTLNEISAAVAPGMPMQHGGAFPGAAASHADDVLNFDITDEQATTLGAEDVMSIDDDDVVAIEDEPTVDRNATVALRQPTAPQPLPNESSRGVTAVVQTPSLFADPTRAPGQASAVSGSSAYREPLENAATSVIQVPSLTRPDNDPHRESAQLLASGGMETFVGTIDPLLIARAIPQQDETELMMSGGLSSDGTFMPPQELTRPAIHAAEGPTDIRALQLGRPEERRSTRPIRSGLGEGGTEGGAQRPAPAIPEPAGTTRFVRVATTVMLSAVLLALAVFALVRSGQLDIEVLRDPERIVRGGIEGASGILGVQPLSMRSVLYPTPHGKILVFTGEVKNTSTQPVQNLEVVAEVRKQDDTVLAAARQPLGVVLSVAELARLETPDAVNRAFATKLAGPLTIAPGERVPFMVVISPAPRELRSSHHHVGLVQGTPPPVPVPVSAPALPAPVITPDTARERAPVQPSQTNSLNADDENGMRKAKMKAKRMKMKRKARDADNGTPSEPAEQ